jgi:putative tricarboxylic transport membrane protein
LNPGTEAVAAAGERRRPWPWLLAAGAAITLFGAFTLWKAFEIRQPTAYRPMGPRVFPVLISVTLIVLGVLFIVETLRGADEQLEEHVATEQRTADHRQAAIIVGLLVAYTLAFNRLGYVVATPLFIAAASRALGSRRLLRDVVVGAAIGVVAFVVFTKWLSIKLPTGVMGDVI